MARNIVQLNNRYIQDENQHRRYLEQERRKKNRFMGWVLILVILLFILPTFNLVQSYRNLLERRTQLMHLQKRYEEISNEKESQKAFANKLKDEDDLEIAKKIIGLNFSQAKEVLVPFISKRNKKIFMSPKKFERIMRGQL